MEIYLWGTSHYLYNDVFYSLKEAVKSANEIIGTNIKEDDLTEGHDMESQRWIPGPHEARNMWQVRFYKREVKVQS